ncbi:beta strand repeat-containing protein [Tessaracoccus sp.]
MTVPDAPTLSGASVGTLNTRANQATNPNFESGLTGWTPAGGAALTRDTVSSPATVPGLLTALDVSSLGAVNGSTVTSAPSGGSSPLGWTVSPYGAGVYQTGGLNGRGYLQQTTAGTGLRWAGNLSATNSTVIYVARKRDTGSGVVLGGQSNSWMLGWWNGQEDVFYSNGYLVWSGAATTTNPKIYAGTYNNASNTHAAYRNGTLLPVYSSGSQGPYGLQTNGYAGGNGFSNSDLYAVYVYDHVLTTAERSTVDSFLSDKYALPVSDYVAQPITGSGSAKLTGGGDVSTLAGSVAAGESVTFSMDYKTDGTVAGSPRMYLQAPTGAVAATTSLPLTQTAPGRYSVTMTAATAGTITAGVYAPTGGVGHFDNVLIEKAPAAGTYFDGNTPIATWDGAANTSSSHITLSANASSLTWTAMSGATSYSLYRVGTATAIYTGTALTFDDAARPWGTNSTYYVTASNAGGASANSNTITLLMVTDASVLSGTHTGQVNTLTWTAPTGADSYALYRVGTLFPIYTGTALTFTDPARPWGVTSDYYVVTNNAGGASPNSNTLTLVTVPDAPTLSGASTPSSRANMVTNPNLESSLTGWNTAGGAALTRDTVSSPATVPGLLTGLDVSSLGAVNGSTVTSAPSGGSSPLNWTVQNGGALYQSAGINGKGYLSQTTAGGGLQWAGNRSASPTTVIYVARTRDTAGILLGAVSNSWWLGWYYGNEDIYYANGWLQSAWPAWTSTARIYAGIYDPATNAHLLFRDGTQVATVGGGSQGPYGLTTNGATGGNFTNSDLYAVYVYDHVLSTVERATVTSALSDRYGIPVAGYIPQPIAGAGSAKLTGGGDVSTLAGSVEAGETVTFSMDYQTEGTVTGTPRMYLQTPTGATATTTSLPLAKTTPGRYSVTMTATSAGTITAGVYAPTGAGVIHFDNVLIEKSTTAGTYFDGNITNGTWDGAVNASASHLTANANTLTWTAPTGATSYDLYRVGTATPIYSGAALTFADPARPWGTSAQYYLTASNAGGTSVNSNTVTVVTVPNVTVVSGVNTAQTNTLTWAAPTGGASYALYRVGTLFPIYTGTALTFDDTARPWGATSSYYVVANNTGGASANSNTITLVTVPDAATLSGTALTTLRANLATNPNFESNLGGWTPAGGASLTRDTTLSAPASIPGLLTSFNAGDLGYANGATVTAAPVGGSSGIGWNAQNGGPTYQTGGLNGQGYLRQTTGGTGLTWANYNLFSSTSSTIIYVARQRDTGSGTVLGSAGGYSWWLGWYYSYEDVSYSYNQWLTYPTFVPKTTNPKIYAATYDTATNAHFTYLNGAQLPVYSNANYGPNGLTTNGYQGANNPSNSDFYAIYVYNRVLSAAERSTVDSYLSTRYALPVSNYVAQPITGTGAAKLTGGGGDVSTLAGSVAAGESVTFSMDYTTEGAVTGTPRMYLQAPTGAVAATTSLPLTQVAPGRYSVTMTAATAGTITAGVYAPTGAGVIHFDNVLIEKTLTAGTYFDGNTPTATWDGASNASSSHLTVNANTLTWTAPAGATSYDLYRVGTAAPIYTGTALTFDDKARPWGTSSQYYMTASNAGGASANSNTVTLATTPDSPS